MDIKNIMSANIEGAMGAASKADSIEKQALTSDIAKVRKSAEDFEAIFFEQMLKTMRSSIQKSGLVDGGNAEEIYTSMLDGEYSKTLASQRSTGLSDAIERQLLDKMGIKQVDLEKRIKMHGISQYRQTPAQPLQDAEKRVKMDTGIKSNKS